MRSGQYLMVLAFCAVVTLPLEFVIGARVWRQPGRLFRAVLPPLVNFLAWDLWAAADEQWRFSDSLTTPLRLPFGVPIDEVLFFVIVPICGLLTLEAVRILSGKGR